MPAATPDYIGEVLHEVRAFFATLRDLARHPVRFAREWADGERHALNPIAFFGTCVGARLLAAAVAGHFRPPDQGVEAAQKLAPQFFWVTELASSQLPLLRALLFTAVVHWRLRKKGSTLPFRASLGVVLFVEGLRDLVRAAVILAVPVALPAHRAALGAVGLFAFVLLAVTLTGAHRLRRATSAIGPIALGGAAVATAMILATSPVWFPLVRDAKKRAGNGHLNITVDGEQGLRVIESRDAGG